MPHQTAREVRQLQRFWRDPKQPFVESRRACQSRACYRPHSHPTFSIGAVDAGNSHFSGYVEHEVELGPGHLVFVPAACVHACNPKTGASWSYQMLHLDADWLQALRREYASETMPADIRIVNNQVLYQQFCQLNTLLFSPASNAAKETALVEFIVMHDSNTMDARLLHIPTAKLKQQLQPVLQQLLRAPASGVALAELATLSGLSRYQLIRAFRTYTGLTPHAWQLNQRVNLARERIRAGTPIAKVAYDLGFADQAHFQRVFKAHTGVTPGHYRR